MSSDVKITFFSINRRRQVREFSK